MEHGLQNGHVADAGDEGDAEASGEDEGLVRQEPDLEDALLLGAHGEAVEELADDDPRLGHCQRLAVDQVRGRERRERKMRRVDAPEEREHHPG